jgi:hypothetical protein
LIQLRRSRPNHRECLILWQKRTSRKRSKNRGDGGTSVYLWEGTTSRVMAANRLYGEIYDFYSVSPEYFAYHHVKIPSLLWSANILVPIQQPVCCIQEDSNLLIQ